MVDATQKIGDIGSVTEGFSAGVGSVLGSLSVPATAFGLTGTVSVSLALDSKILIEFLAQKIGGPIPEEVAKFLEMALAAT